MAVARSLRFHERVKSATSRLTRLDLNLLVVLRELLRERNVTRAAKRVGVSQPAASAALSRLRRYFGDDLLVRRGGKYELSALAFQLVDQVEAVCEGVERLITTGSGFDPTTTRREFEIVMSDFVITVLGERLAGLMNAHAPGARMNVVLVREALSANIGHTIQVADCVVSQPTSRFLIPEMCSTPLFEDRWVCVVAAGNTRFGEDVADLDELTEASWVVPYHDDATFPSVVPVSRQFTRLGVRPRVAVRVDSFHAVPYLVASTDRVALMQERLAAECSRHLPLRILECPRPLEPLEIRLWWHVRHDADPGHRWFRGIVERAAREEVAEPSRPDADWLRVDPA